MKAIVYTSNTGYTARYAKMLSEKMNLPFLTFAEAKDHLSKGDEIIFMGWLRAGSVVGFGKASKLYNVRALCGVGLGTTGMQMENVRKMCRISEDFPLFTLQGGMDMARLRGINRFMIKMLIKMLQSKKRTADEDAMLELILKGGDYVSEDNLGAVIKWFDSVKR